jgi:ATP-dependent exoDNAse (exonuclease V) alpha subunit
LLKILNITRELKKRKKKEKTTNDTAGLETILKVGIGSRIMLRRNINMEKGLVNGALGYVTKIFKNVYNFVYALNILFDNHKSEIKIERFSA